MAAGRVLTGSAAFVGSKLVLVAIQDEGSRYAAAAYPALKRLGALDPFFTDFRHSYALVGYAGALTPSWVRQEQQNSGKGPSVISMRVPLNRGYQEGSIHTDILYPVSAGQIYCSNTKITRVGLLTVLTEWPRPVEAEVKFSWLGDRSSFLSCVLYSVAVSSLEVVLQSEGCEDGTPGCGIAYIKVNGVDYSLHHRGHNVAVFDYSSGEVTWPGWAEVSRDKRRSEMHGCGCMGTRERIDRKEVYRRMKGRRDGWIERSWTLAFLRFFDRCFPWVTFLRHSRHVYCRNKLARSPKHNYWGVSIF